MKVERLCRDPCDLWQSDEAATLAVIAGSIIIPAMPA
jgi:hypothetical protein